MEAKFLYGMNLGIIGIQRLRFDSPIEMPDGQTFFHKLARKWNFYRSDCKILAPEQDSTPLRSHFFHYSSHGFRLKLSFKCINIRLLQKSVKANAAWQAWLDLCGGRNARLSIAQKGSNAFARYVSSTRSISTPASYSRLKPGSILFNLKMRYE